MSDHLTFSLQEHLGFTVQGSEGSASATLELDERHLNPNEIAHGAVAFAVLAPPT